MTNITNYQRKNLFMVIVSACILFIGIYITSNLSNKVKSLYIQSAIEEMQYDLNFFSELVKNLYLENDFVGIEKMLERWSYKNKMDIEIEATSANGFRLYYWQRAIPYKYSEEISKEIKQEGRHLLTIRLKRDLSTVLQTAESAKNQTLYIGFTLASIFGVFIWFFLNRYAFKPMEAEIAQRNKAEHELKIINDELEKRVAERTEQVYRLSSVVEQTDDIVVITDQAGFVEYANPSFERISGYSSHDVIGRRLGMIKSGMHDDDFYKDLWTTISSGKSFRAILVNRAKDGNIYYEEKTITPLKDKDGIISHYVSTGKDISEQVEIQNKMHHMATHDVLTDLPNRAMLEDRLKHACSHALRNNRKVALLFFDLDRFKEINDSLGHAIGDIFLRNIANKLSNSIRSDDTLARFGGDEFVLIMESIHEQDAIDEVARKILKLVAQPVIIDGYEINSSTSIGITIFPDDTSDGNELLKNADVAMYRAKNEGGNRFEYFTKDMSAQAYKRMEMQNWLSHALENDEFCLHYQPKIDLNSGNISGVEALIRWNHPQKGLIMPDEFIPLQEESGMIIEVGKWVIKQACCFNEHIREKGHSPMRVAINLSAKQFNDDSLVPFIQNLCKNNKNFLEVEITESTLIQNFDEVITTLKEFSKIGVHISIDDFGTGYSSLGYLKRLPINSLKIDRSFVSELPKNKDDAAIVNAIIAMASSLQIDVVAEGVETAMQLEHLRGSGCDEMQGYYISKPMPEEIFIEWLENYNPDDYIKV
jgi:diguanylate cyclase (GGDEF)-like protein/PAS domain S-box-containing protein